MSKYTDAADELRKAVVEIVKKHHREDNPRAKKRRGTELDQLCGVLCMAYDDGIADARKAVKP